MRRFDIEEALSNKTPVIQEVILLRSALRALVIALPAASENEEGESLVLAMFRAFVTSLAHLAFPNDTKIDKAKKRAGGASFALTMRFDASIRSAFSAAMGLATAREESSFRASSALSSVDSAFMKASMSATLITEQAFAEIAIVEHKNPLSVFGQELWSQFEQPAISSSNWSKFSDYSESKTQAWSFWVEWYESILAGCPQNWELQRRVALIDNAIWEAGPAAVAKEIKIIQHEFDRQNVSSETRQPNFEPDSVERVLSNKRIAARSTAYVSAAIGEAVEVFHTETGWNEIPETFVPLAQIPRSLQSIVAILELPEQFDETKQQLREEIGRLNAKVAKLEKELEALKNKGDPVFLDAVKKSLGDWKLWATVIAGGWIVLGDVEGAQARLENIQSLRDEIFGTPPAPSPDIAPFEDHTVDV